jgi:hypothetical protein
LTVLIVIDAQPNAEDLQAAFASKRDAVVANTAGLMARLIEQDCKPEFQAVSSSGNAGVGFALLFQQLMELGVRSLQGPAGIRAGALLSVDLLKHLDSNVALDLFGPNRRSSIDLSERAKPGQAAAPELTQRGTLPHFAGTRELIEVTQNGSEVITRTLSRRKTRQI